MTAISKSVRPSHLVSCRRSITAALLSIVALLLFGPRIDTAGAADAVYSSIKTDQFLREWLLLGPLALPREANVSDEQHFRELSTRDLLESAGGEATIAAAAGQSIHIGDREYTWNAHSSRTDPVELVSVFSPRDEAVAYAAATIEVAEDQTRLIGLGSDDAVRVWLNGELVHENIVRRALSPDADVFPVQLKKGNNRLLVKIVNAGGRWGFALRFVTPAALQRPLFRAVWAGDESAVEKLVAQGVDVKAAFPSGLSPTQVAMVRGNTYLAEYLQSKGAAPAEPFDAAQVFPTLLNDITRKDLPGLAVLVARDGKVLLSHAVGLADLSHAVPITPATKFRIGSITKQFAAAAILKLQQEGKLSVTDKVNKYFPDYPRGDEVTIHHLLTHTSGIRSFTGKPDFLAKVAAPAKNEQVLESFKNEPFDFAPGSKFAYNNSGYFLLGMIVEKVSGQPFEAYLRSTFFEPLEMPDTGVHSATTILRHEATGYSIEQGRLTRALDWDMSQVGAAGNLYSTVADLMRWNEGVFNGQVLSKESLEAAFTPVKLDTGEEPSMNYGYGWLIGERRGLKTISHSGGLNGWSTLLVRYVDQNTTIVVLHNALPTLTSLAPSEIADMAADVFLWQEMAAKPRYEVDTTVDPSTFSDYVGRYDLQVALLRVTLDGEQLSVQISGQPKHPVFASGKDKFFLKVVDARIEFDRNDEGRVVAIRNLQGGRTLRAQRLPDYDEVEVSEEILDRYVGKYTYAGIGVLTVRREGARLLAQMTGQPEFELAAKAEDEFFWKDVPAEAKFIVGDEGQVEKLIHRQAGNVIEAQKTE